MSFINFIGIIENPVENNNDNASDSNKATIIVYADDNTPMQSAKTQSDLKEMLQLKADVIIQWFKKNEMIVSGGKTNFLLLELVLPSIL